MIVMNVELHNLFAFENFHINFSYPKKIVNSTIADECLPGKPNFRYKKVNIIMGANATGKTSFGKALMYIFNAIAKRDLERITQWIREKRKSAYFSIDFLCDPGALYRVNCQMIPTLGESHRDFDLKIEVSSATILKNDSYESTVKKLKPMEYDKDQYPSPLHRIPRFGWLFTYPELEAKLLMDDLVLDTHILKAVLQTLDTQIQDVEKSKEVENSYIIRSENGDVLIQNGEVVDKNILSSGTRMGLDIGYILSSLKQNRHEFYYCDEKFSFVHSDVEIAMLSLMISWLGKNGQLFFTTHNLDLLEMDLPIHSFTFLRKDTTIEPIYPKDFIKKNDISLRNAVRNDVFNMTPDIGKILLLEEDFSDESE